MDGLDKEKMRGKKYQCEILNKLTTRLKKTLFDKADIHFTDNKIVQQLKEKYNETNDRDLKTKILSVLSQDMSIREIHKLIDASLYMINKTKKLVGIFGILCDATKKSDKTS